MSRRGVAGGPRRLMDLGVATEKTEAVGPDVGASGHVLAGGVRIGSAPRRTSLSSHPRYRSNRAEAPPAALARLVLAMPGWAATARTRLSALLSRLSSSTVSRMLASFESE
jgi:hypothetical protein